MNKQTDQLELSRIVAQQTLLDERVVEAFIGQLFTEIEKSIIVDSHVKVDGLGLFRIIKSGDSHRILYLGTSSPINQSIDVSHINRQSVNGGGHNYENPESEIQTIVQNEIPADSDSSGREVEIIKVDNTVSRNEDEADAIVIRNFLESKKNADTSTRSTPTNQRKLNLVKTCIITLIVLALLGIGYMVLLGSSVKPKEKTSKAITFKELDNTDTINYSRIIIPESDVSLQYIAKTYYGNDIYWSYIYEANKNIVNNQFIIQAGSITKIPKIAVDLVDLNNGNEASIAQSLGNAIYKGIK